MKSFVYCAPMLPPPPYTWLITTSVPPGFAVAGSAPTSDTSPTASPIPSTRRTPPTSRFIRSPPPFDVVTDAIRRKVAPSQTGAHSRSRLDPGRSPDRHPPAWVGCRDARRVDCDRPLRGSREGGFRPRDRRAGARGRPPLPAERREARPGADADRGRGARGRRADRTRVPAPGRRPRRAAERPRRQALHGRRRRVRRRRALRAVPAPPVADTAGHHRRAGPPRRPERRRPHRRHDRRRRRGRRRPAGRVTLSSKELVATGVSG